MENSTLDTYQKALAFNMDKGTYGTVAEIGAGQETVRWFFKVGGAAGSIAKAMSAYDMKFSDTIYGECQRYVRFSKKNIMKTWKAASSKPLVVCSAMICVCMYALH